MSEWTMAANPASSILMSKTGQKGAGRRGRSHSLGGTSAHVPHSDVRIRLGSVNRVATNTTRLQLRSSACRATGTKYLSPVSTSGERPALSVHGPTRTAKLAELEQRRGLPSISRHSTLLYSWCTPTCSAWKRKRASNTSEAPVAPCLAGKSGSPKSKHI